MPAARYWRLIGLAAYGGGDIELSEIALYSGGTRIDGTATVTSSLAPVSGSLANLSDANTSTLCKFAASDIANPGFYVQWDFGTPTEVSELRLAAAGSQALFPVAINFVSVSADGLTTVEAGVQGVTYPGANSYTTSVSAGLIPTTWNPLDKGSACVLTNGNLTATGGLSNGAVRSTFGATSGKYYWEVQSTISRHPIIGVAKNTAPLTYPGDTVDGWAYYGPTGEKYTNDVLTTYGPVWSSASDVIGIALDMDAGTIAFYRNGTSMGVAFTGLTGTIHAMTGGDTDGATSNVTANFGATALVYSPPSGFAAGFGLIPFLAPVSTTQIPKARAVVDTSAFWREAILGSVGAATTNSATPVRDIYTAGRGQIVATVKEDGTPTDTPVRRKVRLFRDRDGLFVRETWSNATTGAYSFTEIDENETYSVVSYDHNDNFRAVIADRITPTVA